MPVILQGEPVLALEAGAASLIAKKDVVLNLVSGVYGAGFGFWARRYCAELLEIRVPYDEVIDPASVAAQLEGATGYPRRRRLPPRHSLRDHQSGRRDRPDRRRARRLSARRRGFVVRRHGCRSRFLFRRSVHNRTQQVPRLPAGSLARRRDAARLGEDEAKSDAPRDSILSFLDWEHAWRPDRPFPFTPSVAEINGLDAALDRYLGEGPERVWARHALTAAACRAGCSRWA
jgi:pyridoxamine---pyruvate transaminase